MEKAAGNNGYEEKDILKILTKKEKKNTLNNRADREKTGWFFGEPDTWRSTVV